MQHDPRRLWRLLHPDVCHVVTGVFLWLTSSDHTWIRIGNVFFTLEPVSRIWQVRVVRWAPEHPVFPSRACCFSLSPSLSRASRVSPPSASCAPSLSVSPAPSRAPRHFLSHPLRLARLSTRARPSNRNSGPRTAAPSWWLPPRVRRLSLSLRLSLARPVTFSPSLSVSRD